MSDQELTVQARITSWSESKFGRYAVAEILTPDVEAKKALFGANRFRWAPELDTPFTCIISPSDKGWKVVALPDEEGTTVLLKGTFKEVQGQGRDRIWQIEVSAGQSQATGIAHLKNDVLQEAGLIDFEPGALLEFEALKTSHACTVTRIMFPQIKDAFEDGEHIAFVRADWRPEKDKGVRVAVLSRNCRVWIHMYIASDLLKRCGITSLVKAPYPWTIHQTESRNAIHAWQETLQNGNTDERDALSMDRLLVTTQLYASKGKTGLSLRKLVAPLRMRSPLSPDEVIDWISAHVVDIKPSAPRANRSEVHEQPQPDHPTVTGSLRKTTPPNAASQVTFKVQAPGLGRGEVQGRFYEPRVKAAGLAIGVPCIVTLAAYNLNGEARWTIKKVHQSEPAQRIENDA